MGASCPSAFDGCQNSFVRENLCLDLRPEILWMTNLLECLLNVARTVFGLPCTEDRSQRSLHRASKLLRGILLGGLTHVDCLVGVNLVRVAHYLKHHFQLEWDAKRGSPSHAFKQCLQDKGWQVQQPWVWAIQRSFCKIDLRRPDVDLSLATTTQTSGWLEMVRVW